MDDQTMNTPRGKDLQESWSEQCRENEATLSLLQGRMQEALAAKGEIAGSAAINEVTESNIDNLGDPRKTLHTSLTEIKEFQNQELIANAVEV